MLGDFVGETVNALKNGGCGGQHEDVCVLVHIAPDVGAVVLHREHALSVARVGQVCKTPCMSTISDLHLYLADLADGEWVFCDFADQDARTADGFCQFCGSTNHDKARA